MYTCQRPGCKRRKRTKDKPGCSALCGLVITLVAEAKNVAETLGSSATTDRFVSDTEALSDAIGNVYEIRQIIRDAAAEAGVNYDSLAAGRLN